MRKLHIGTILTIGLAFAGTALAAVPTSNRMTLGEISNSLPAADMRNFYTKMEPIMRKYFGPPLSNINLKIDANLTGTVHNTGYTDNEQTLVLAGQARSYQENKDKDPSGALYQIHGSMMHELSHGMFYYGNQRVTFHPQWINEGWAKLQEILMAQELGAYNFSAQPYFNYYLDRDTVAGTINWGSSKQITNHGLDYDITSITHLILLSAASTANDNLDFLKTFNSKIYDWVKANGQTNISLEQYKNIMRKLLQGKTIDGQSAFDWYFNNPDTLTQGKQGAHLGITTEPGGIISYAFDRKGTGEDIQETALPNINITIKAVNYNNEILVKKTVKTDADGNVRIDLPKNGDLALMVLEATATISGKPFTARTFYFNPPPQESKLSGILINENNQPLPAKYISLLKSDLPFEYKDKGVFVITVPTATRTVTLDFLGLKQEVTKGPFTRMFAMAIPSKYITDASQKSDLELSSGIINNYPPTPGSAVYRSSQNRNLLVGLASLLAVAIGAIAIIKYPFSRRKK